MLLACMLWAPKPLGGEPSWKTQAQSQQQAGGHLSTSYRSQPFLPQCTCLFLGEIHSMQALRQRNLELNYAELNQWH